MIYIYHGEDTAASRKSMRELTDKLQANPSVETVNLNGDTISQTDLIQAVESQSLFDADRIVIIEGLLSRRPSTEKDSLISFLSLIPYPLSLILWEPKTVSAAVLKKFSLMKEAKIQEFKLPFLLFKFLDSLIPGRGKQVSELFGELTNAEPVEMIVFMLARRVTQLLFAKSNQSNAMSDVKSDWQRQKLISQASEWSENRLLRFHKQLLEIDEAVKTGSTPADYHTHLDILLASL